MQRSAGVRMLPVAGGVAALLAVLYAPIAFSSMFFTLDPGAPRLQVRLDELIVGESDATGPGSVAAARTEAYRDQRVVMLLHTTAGTLALLLAVWQIATGARGRRGHRATGRAYLVAVLVSMGAAVAFLLRAPRVDHVGQVALSWQLWVLALGTVGATLAGVLAARAGQGLAHRCWMTLALCFLLTAPVLRLAWVALGPLLPDHDQLTRLDAGAVSLAVLAPGGALLVAISVLERCRGTGPGTGGRIAPGWRMETAAIAIAGLGLLLIVITRPGASAPDDGRALVPPLYTWFHVAPFVLLLSVVLLRGRQSPVALWPALIGTACAPLAAVICTHLAVPQLGGTEAWLAGLMVAPGFPIVAALAVLLVSHGGWRFPGRPRLRAPALSSVGKVRGLTDWLSGGRSNLSAADGRQPRPRVGRGARRVHPDRCRVRRRATPS